MLKLSSTQQNLTALKKDGYTKASNVNFTFFPPYIFRRNYSIFVVKLKLSQSP